MHILQAYENDCFQIYVNYTKIISGQLFSSSMNVCDFPLSNEIHFTDNLKESTFS